jgi:hypothetical protein
MALQPHRKHRNLAATRSPGSTFTRLPGLLPALGLIASVLVAPTSIAVAIIWASVAIAIISMAISMAVIATAIMSTGVSVVVGNFFSRGIAFC